MKSWRFACVILLSLAIHAEESAREAFPSEFKELPPTIRQDLHQRGCTVPQPPGARKQENVIRGRFRNPKQDDWAVLCDIRSQNVSMILIYANSQAVHSPAVLDKSSLSDQGCWVAISAVSENYIEEHYRAYGGPKPPPIDHQGIDVGICEKASVIRYFYQGKWLTLTGAD